MSQYTTIILNNTVKSHNIRCFNVFLYLINVADEPIVDIFGGLSD